MRFASIALKIVVAILLFVLFSLFLLYATGFGEDGNLIDLAMSNVLIATMVLVLVISALLSLLLEFYEQNKYQTQEICLNLSEKIKKLEELAPELKQITSENAEKIAELAVSMNEKIEENSVKFDEYMTQFANLSVQVFAKDKSTENMAHREVIAPNAQQKAKGDYFNHYTSMESAESKPVDKKPENQVARVIKNETVSENIPEQEAQLSTIFNDDLAQTLSELEIMKDEDMLQETQDIDLTAYFADNKKNKFIS